MKKRTHPGHNVMNMQFGKRKTWYAAVVLETIRKSHNAEKPHKHSQVSMFCTF